MSSRHHSSGGASSESKLEKEKTRLIQEKCQAMLNEMLRDEDNKYCVDCDAKGGLLISDQHLRSRKLYAKCELG